MRAKFGEAVVAEILQERTVSSRNHRRPRGVKRKMSNYNLRRKDGPASRPLDFTAAIRIA